MAPAMEVTTAKRKRTVASHAEGDVDGVNEEIDADNLTNDVHDKGAEHEKHTSKKKKPSTTEKGSSTAKGTRVQTVTFNDLSAELRNKIYELALTDPTGISLSSGIMKGYRRTAIRVNKFLPVRPPPKYGPPKKKAGSSDLAPKAMRVTLSPALLRVSKQVCSEGINYLYGQRLSFDTPVALYQFLCVCGLLNQTRLRAIEVHHWYDRSPLNFHAFSLLSGATKLQSLLLDAVIGVRAYRPEGVAGQICRGMYVFLEAYGKANGGKDAGVQILQIGATEMTHRRRQSRSRQDLSDDAFVAAVKKVLSKLLGKK